MKTMVPRLLSLLAFSLALSGSTVVGNSDIVDNQNDLENFFEDTFDFDVDRNLRRGSRGSRMHKRISCAADQEDIDCGAVSHSSLYGRGRGGTGKVVCLSYKRRGRAEKNSTVCLPDPVRVNRNGLMPRYSCGCCEGSCNFVECSCGCPLRRGRSDTSPPIYGVYMSREGSTICTSNATSVTLQVMYVRDEAERYECVTECPSDDVSEGQR